MPFDADYKYVNVIETLDWAVQRLDVYLYLHNSLPPVLLFTGPVAVCLPLAPLRGTWCLSPTTRTPNPLVLVPYLYLYPVVPVQAHISMKMLRSPINVLGTR